MCSPKPVSPPELSTATSTAGKRSWPRSYGVTRRLSAGRSDRAAAGASDPVAGLDAWLERYLDVFYEPRRAARTALFSSPAVVAAVPLAAELEEMRQIFCQPLVEVLRAGHDSGILRSPTPEADAYSLFTLVSAVANGGDSQFLSRSEAKAHVMRFSWPAFGLPLEN